MNETIDVVFDDETAVLNDALCQFLRTSDWEKARSCLLQIESTNRREDRASTAARDDRIVVVEDDRSALHCVCGRRDAPLDVVRSLCRSRVGLPLSVNGLGRTPLHTACERAPGDVASFLARFAPRAAAVADHAGWLPLHCAVRHDRTVAAELAVARPESLLAATPNWPAPAALFYERWRYGLNLATRPTFAGLRRGNPLDGSVEGTVVCSNTLCAFLRALRRLRKTTEGEGAPSLDDDDEDWTPLHDAFRLKDIPHVFFLLLMQTMPEELIKHDAENRDFPLHVACSIPAHPLPKPKRLRRRR